MNAILKASQVQYIHRPALRIEELTAELEAMKCEVMVLSRRIRDREEQLNRLMGIKGVK